MLAKLKKERSNLTIRIKVAIANAKRVNDHLTRLRQELDAVNDKIIKEQR